MIQRKRILLVDDNVSQLDLIQILFENDGFHVDQAINGVLAISELEKQTVHPDLIVMDLMMPKLSGTETVKRLRILGIKCPIIAFTSIDEEDILQEAIDAGCNSVLMKPCKPDLLLAEVRKLLIATELN